jgi:hypothetical protein
VRQHARHVGLEPQHRPLRTPAAALLHAAYDEFYAHLTSPNRFTVTPEQPTRKKVSGRPLHEVSKLTAGKRLRQWFPGRFQRFDRLFDEVAEFGKDLLGIVAMAAAVEQLWAATDEAVVFVRPLDHFHVSVASRH